MGFAPLAVFPLNSLRQKKSQPLEMGVEKMSDQLITLHLEIPPEVAQQDVWELEEQLGQVTGITTDLRQPKDLLAATLLFIQVAGPYVGQAVTIAGGINTIHDLAQTLY